jgi:hypothetical protein
VYRSPGGRPSNLMPPPKMIGYILSPLPFAITSSSLQKVDVTYLWLSGGDRVAWSVAGVHRYRRGRNVPYQHRDTSCHAGCHARCHRCTVQYCNLHSSSYFEPKSFPTKEWHQVTYFASITQTIAVHESRAFSVFGWSIQW